MPHSKTKKSNAILTRPGFATVCAQELQERWNITPTGVGKAIVSIHESAALPALSDIIFGRQVLPHAIHYGDADMPTCVDQITKRIEVLTKRANRQAGAWTLHAFAVDDDPALQIAMKLEKALLSRLRVSLPAFAKRYLSSEKFSEEPREDSDLILQVFVSTTDGTWVSVSSVHEGTSTAIGGMKRMRKLAGAPSRSASKLEEALAFMGNFPTPGQTAVDLGAAPGGWTFVIARHGTNVVAVDHANLDIPNAAKLKGTITHLKENGLKYLPEETVDWLCCDMVMGGRQTLEVLSNWATADKMRAFVVNVKLPAANPWPIVQEVLKQLNSMTDWSYLKAKHLFHDRAEITVMGRRTL